MSKKENKSVKRADKITAKLEAQAEGIVMANEGALRRAAELQSLDYEVVRENFRLVVLANLRSQREHKILATCAWVSACSAIASVTCAIAVNGKRIMKEREAQNQ